MLVAETCSTKCSLEMKRLWDLHAKNEGEPEAIMNEIVELRVLWYCIKWKGFDNTFNTWDNSKEFELRFPKLVRQWKNKS